MESGCPVRELEGFIYLSFETPLLEAAHITSTIHNELEPPEGRLL